MAKTRRKPAADKPLPVSGAQIRSMQSTLGALSKHYARSRAIHPFTYELTVIGPKGPNPPRDDLVQSHLALAKALIDAAVKQIRANR